MRFGLGRVVRYELITTARRGRFYIARVAYVLSMTAWTRSCGHQSELNGGG
jgi:hypothetical protein